MKSIDKEFWGFLSVLWFVFIVWELQIQYISSSVKEHMIRFDLMVLPVLLLVTIYAIYTHLKTNRP